MAKTVAIYTIIHQPRRLRLPARVVPYEPDADHPAAIEAALFDETANERYLRKVADRCYRPALRMFAELAEAGLKFNIGLSYSFIRQVDLWDLPLAKQLEAFVRHQNVELVGVEPYHSFLFYLDIEQFLDRMEWMRDELEARFGERVRVTDTTEMFMSHEVYHALQQSGFEGALLDGRPWVFDWRDTTHLYTIGPPSADSLFLLPRHYTLSDDVGFRFSDRSWEGYPLKVPAYVDSIEQAQGEFVLLAWDFETFGEHHAKDTGIFEFVRHLPNELKRRGIEVVTCSDLLERFRGKAYDLPHPPFGSTWAGSGGMEFFLGNSVQQAVFLLMHHAYNVAKLSGDERILDLAMWLAQSDNLHLIQWHRKEGSEAGVSWHFTPEEWRQLGPDKIPIELQRVYTNFINAVDDLIRARG